MYYCDCGALKMPQHTCVVAGHHLLVASECMSAAIYSWRFQRSTTGGIADGLPQPREKHVRYGVIRVVRNDTNKMATGSPQKLRLQLLRSCKHRAWPAHPIQLLMLLGLSKIIVRYMIDKLIPSNGLQTSSKLVKCLQKLGARCFRSLERRGSTVS